MIFVGTRMKQAIRQMPSWCEAEARHRNHEVQQRHHWTSLETDCCKYRTPHQRGDAGAGVATRCKTLPAVPVDTAERQHTRPSGLAADIAGDATAAGTGCSTTADAEAVRLLRCKIVVLCSMTEI